MSHYLSDKQPKIHFHMKPIYSSTHQLKIVTLIISNGYIFMELSCKALHHARDALFQKHSLNPLGITIDVTKCTTYIYMEDLKQQKSPIS